KRDWSSDVCSSELPIKISKCTKRSFLEKIHWNLKIFMALNSRLLKEIQRLIVQIFYPFMVLRYGLENQRVRKHCLQIRSEERRVGKWGKIERCRVYEREE